MSEQMIELIARELEPGAWAALGTGDRLAYKNRRTSSLRKAQRVASVIAGKVAELREAALLVVNDPCSSDNLKRLEAALAPYPERRSE